MPEQNVDVSEFKAVVTIETEGAIVDFDSKTNEVEILRPSPVAGEPVLTRIAIFGNAVSCEFDTESRKLTITQTVRRRTGAETAVTEAATETEEDSGAEETAETGAETAVTEAATETEEDSGAEETAETGAETAGSGDSEDSGQTQA